MMTSSSGVRGIGRHKALHIIPHYWRGTTEYQGLCNLASLFNKKTCVTKLWITNRDWLRCLYRRYHVSLRVLLRDSVVTHRKSTITTSLNAVPSYIVMMCGWQSVDMISISLRMWTRSCSSLIFSFLIDFMATLKKKKRGYIYIYDFEKKNYISIKSSRD